MLPLTTATHIYISLHNTNWELVTASQPTRSNSSFELFSAVKLELPVTIQVSKTFNGSSIFCCCNISYDSIEMFSYKIFYYLMGQIWVIFQTFLFYIQKMGLTLMKWHKYSQQNFTLYIKVFFFEYFIFDKR